MKWQAWAYVDEHGNMLAESGFRCVTETDNEQ